jgi:hypothetical protein
VLAAGLAADSIICALYFTTIFAILAARIPAEDQDHSVGVGDDPAAGDKQQLPPVGLRFLVGVSRVRVIRTVAR